MMRKTVICVECKVPFLVEGPLGLQIELARTASCPYPGCQGSTEVLWPMDSIHKARPIYNNPLPEPPKPPST